MRGRVLAALLLTHVLLDSTDAAGQSTVELEYVVELHALDVAEGEEWATARAMVIEQVVRTVRERLTGFGYAPVHIGADGLNLVVRLPYTHESWLSTVRSIIEPTPEFGFHASHSQADAYLATLATHSGLTYDDRRHTITVSSVEQADALIAEAQAAAPRSQLRPPPNTLLIRDDPRSSGSVGIYLVASESPVDVSDLVRTAVYRDEVTDRPLVSMTFSSSGSGTLCTFTWIHVGRPVAIIFEGDVLTVPLLTAPICQGRVRINFARGVTNEEGLDLASDLAVRLRAAALVRELRLVTSGVIVRVD